MQRKSAQRSLASGPVWLYLFLAAPTHNRPPPSQWEFNTRIPTDHPWHRSNPLRQTRQTNGLWPGCGDTGHDKGDHGHGSECGNEENHRHGSGWGDEGGTGHSMVWRSKSRSASRTWTSIDHTQSRGSHESYGSHHCPRHARNCKRPRSRSHG